MLFPNLFHLIFIHIFHPLSLHKVILKLSMSFHTVLFSSESFPYLNLLYTDYSNKTPKAAMVFGTMEHHYFTKDTTFLIYPYADSFAFFTKFKLSCHQ